MWERRRLLLGRGPAERRNLSVDMGELVSLIADNGATKSTFIKNPAGVVKPTSGEIFIRGELVSNWSRGSVAPGGDRNRVSGSRAGGAAIDRPQHLYGLRAR
jgi:ABC-type sugar transport system ATPase subunit